jgi:hypothetical protein
LGGRLHLHGVIYFASRFGRRATAGLGSSGMGRVKLDAFGTAGAWMLRGSMEGGAAHIT